MFPLSKNRFIPPQVFDDNNTEICRFSVVFGYYRPVTAARFPSISVYIQIKISLNEQGYFRGRGMRSFDLLYNIEKRGIVRFIIINLATLLPSSRAVVRFLSVGESCSLLLRQRAKSYTPEKLIRNCITSEKCNKKPKNSFINDKKNNVRYATTSREQTRLYT